ncbi:MAG: hypothetical protein ACFFDQ_10590 [Candidatus Thorarchaeota archaeon]
MVDVRSQIEEYLDILNMRYYWNEEEGVFELVFSERKDELSASESTEDDALSFKYTVFIRPGEKWIQVYAAVYPLDNVPDEKKQSVILDLLHTNRKYAEVCFDFDEPRGCIGTSQEMMIKGLNFDTFREEFLAVPWAVKKFWTEIATKHGL